MKNKKWWRGKSKQNETRNEKHIRIGSNAPSKSGIALASRCLKQPLTVHHVSGINIRWEHLKIVRPYYLANISGDASSPPQIRKNTRSKQLLLCFLSPFVPLQSPQVSSQISLPILPLIGALSKTLYFLFFPFGRRETVGKLI